MMATVLWHHAPPRPPLPDLNVLNFGRIKWFTRWSWSSCSVAPFIHPVSLGLIKIYKRQSFNKQTSSCLWKTDIRYRQCKNIWITYATMTVKSYNTFPTAPLIILGHTAQNTFTAVLILNSNRRVKTVFAWKTGVVPTLHNVTCNEAMFQPLSSLSGEDYVEKKNNWIYTQRKTKGTISRSQSQHCTFLCNSAFIKNMCILQYMSFCIVF